MIAGLVLAAGAGSRLGQPKAPLVVGGERLIDRAVRVLREGGCDVVYVVLGAWVGDVAGAEVVLNPEWQTGMASSLKAGLEALSHNNAITAAVVALVDTPGMTAAAVNAVINNPGELVVAVYDGQRGHPLKLEKSHWQPILAVIEGDTGARAYLRGRTDVVELELSSVSAMSDIDTVEDLEAAQRASGFHI